MNRRGLEVRYLMLQERQHLTECIARVAGGGLKSTRFDNVRGGSGSSRKVEDMADSAERARERILAIDAELRTTEPEVANLSKQILRGGFRSRSVDAMVFRLRYMEGYSNDEIATVLGPEYDGRPYLIELALDRCFEYLGEEDPDDDQ